MNKDHHDETPQNIDIYQHLKLNMKNTKPICECTSLPSLYCIPCKVSVCQKCTYDIHSKHLIVSKKSAEMSNDNVDAYFNEIENVIDNDNIYRNCLSIKQTLIDDVNAYVESLVQKIMKYKDNKINEIEHMFSHLDFFIEMIKDQIKETKTQMKQYNSKYGEFYSSCDDSSSKSSPTSNTAFLIQYDMMNIIYNKTKDIKAIADAMSIDIANYNKIENYQRNDINQTLDDILFDPLYVDNIDKTFKDNEIVITPHIRKDIELVNGVYYPISHFLMCSDKLNQSHFKEINERIYKYTQQIESFKDKVYNSLLKNKSYKDIEKEISIFENKKLKGSEALFVAKRNTNPSSSSHTGNTTLRNNKNQIDHLPSSKNDINLNEPTLKKYFNYLTLDLYANNFKAETTELQSSHFDLLIKIDPNEDEEKDFAKIGEHTNVLTIYEKKNKKMIKKRLNLTKNPYGYTTFPIGCRSLMLGDKIYITGGKSEKQVYQTVLIYDRKQDKLKRIMDMVYPRCYHTMIYNDAFETIMVFGGELNNTVEIFDPLVNRWIALPNMNVPRANVFFQFDKPRGMIYTLFGMEGKLLENKFSDVIECLDLTKLNEGWGRMDYYNGAEIKLKTFLNLFPLSNSLILAYGGESGRNKKRQACVINLAKGEIGKIDKQFADQLKMESKKSVKLSTIVSSLNLKY